MILLAPAQGNKRLGLSSGGFLLFSRKTEKLGENQSALGMWTGLGECVPWWLPGYNAVCAFVPGCVCVLGK